MRVLKFIIILAFRLSKLGEYQKYNGQTNFCSSSISLSVNFMQTTRYVLQKFADESFFLRSTQIMCILSFSDGAIEGAGYNGILEQLRELGNVIAMIKA